MRFGALSLPLVVAVLGLVPISATAQALATPAEFPPSSYSAPQYVDSTGCAFVRAGNGGVVNWVPRVSRDREQLCGFAPTVIAPEVATAAPSGPIILLDDEPTAAVASDEIDVTSTPQLRSHAEVCEGKTGVLTGYVSASGEAVDCGPGEEEVVAAVPPPPPVPAPAPRQVMTPRAPAPVVAATPAPVPEMRRVTLVEICAEIAATGKTIVDSATGAPVACPTAAPVLAANTGPSAPGAPMMAAAPLAPALQAPAAATLPVARTTRSRTASAAPVFSNPLAIFADPPVPASNPSPASVAGERITPPAGYERVWTDGRINPQRGLQRVTREEAIAMGLIDG